MNRNVMKLAVLVGVGFISWQTASHAINTLVLEIESKEDTFVDVIIQQQVEETLKEAEEKIEEVIEEENIVIEQEEVAIKPAEPPKEPVVEEPKEEEVAKEPEQEVVPEEEVATSPETGEGDALTSDTLAGLTVLTEDEVAYLANYLIENYFLFGERYYTVETDPERYERKKLANDMETYIINSIGEVQGLMQQIFSLTSEDLKPLLEEAITLQEAFQTEYANVGEHGEAFQAIYDESMGYFEAYTRGLGHAVTTFETLETTTNKALVLPLMLKSINQDILPAVKDVLNQGFAVKEKTNQIYIEGIDGSFLLTPKEVMAILQNPKSVLPSTEAEDITPDASVEEGAVETTPDVSTEEGASEITPNVSTEEGTWGTAPDISIEEGVTGTTPDASTEEDATGAMPDASLEEDVSDTTVDSEV